MFNKKAWTGTVRAATAFALIGGGFGSVPIYAEDEVIEEVVVTGSRIQKANLVSSSPVTQVSSEDIRIGGITRIEDLMNDLPQVAASNSSGDANGASGTATLNLRNLGENRNLVLINGRRMPAGSPTSTGADLNQIPAALVERVELLTGGASSTYGSDAISGVANFIMVRDFEGVKFNYQHSFYQHDNDNSRVQALNAANNFTAPSGSSSDGQTDTFDIVFGANTEDGRGNVTAYASYRDVSAVRQATRDYSNCALSGDTSGCGGSSTLPTGRFTDFGTAKNGNSFDFITQGNEFVPRNGLLYNYAPANFYQRPDQRVAGGAFAHYELTPQVELYSELMFTDDRTNAQIAPSGAFFVTSTLPCGNPLMSAQQFQAVCGADGLTAADTQNLYIGRRNVEGGFRNEDIRHTSYRGVVGVTGDVNDAWAYDFYYQYSEVALESTYNNELSTTKLKRALNAVDDGNGNIVCQSVVDGSDPSCVPYNVFQTGGVTQAQVNYLSIPLFARGTTDQKIISGFVTGDLSEYGVKLPGANNGVNIVLGAEYRKERLEYNPDNNYQSGDGAGQGGPTPPVAGGFDVKEWFFEANIPLLQDQAMARELAVDIGYRYSDYSTNVDTDTYKVAIGWVPVDGLKFRASYQSAIRHANLRELFRPQGITLFDGSDPCSGATPKATAAQCANSGVSAAQYGTIADSPAGQFNQLSGGNPLLTPEDSTTVSYGVIWAPEAIEGLTVTMDYYDIDVVDAITSISAQTTLDQCLATGGATFCGQVNRGAGTGTLWLGTDNIVATNINIGFFQTEGIDLTVEYSMDLEDMGSLLITNNGNYVLEWDQEEYPGNGVVSCTGKWGGSCGSPTVELKNNLRASWYTPWDVNISTTVRYIDGLEALDSSQADLDSRTYLDLNVDWNISENTTVNVGIQNLLDKEPPLSDPGPSIFGNGNTFPGTYDALGRYIFVGASMSL